MSSERAWTEVKADVTALGEQLKQHYEAGGADDAEKRAQLEAAVDGLGRAVTDVFDSLGKVLQDPEVRAGSSRVAQSFSQAVAATLGEVGSELQKVLQRQAPPGSAQAAEGTGQPPSS